MRRGAPQQTDFLYTDEEWARHLAEGLTPQDWANLHAQAKDQPHTSTRRLPSKPYAPPPAPRPHVRTTHQILTRVVDGCKIAKTDARWVDQIGSGLDEWIVWATDGHRALCVPGRPTGAPRHWLAPYLARTGPTIILPPDLEPALVRMRICSNDQSHAVSFAWSRESGCLILSAKGNAAEVEAWEWLRASGDAPPCRWQLSADYLLDICGQWPLTVRLPPVRLPQPTHGLLLDPFVFAPPDDAWRYILMPMRI